VPSDPRPSGIVYDIGNVLIRWDVRALYRTIFDDPSEMEDFLSNVWTPMENDRCDRGAPFAEVIAETVERHPRHEAAVRAIWDRWIETIPGPVDGAWELVEELHAAEFPLFGLSNFSAETFPLVRDVYRGFDRFRDIVISGEHPGLAKPDPGIFRVVCERSGLEPQSLLFVDDSPANTAAAAALGFATVTFTDTPSLRAELVSRGVLSGSG
jgi:2-haloacid dehalogenase/putative hydrolase of the HAD superfamily